MPAILLTLDSDQPKDGIASYLDAQAAIDRTGFFRSRWLVNGEVAAGSDAWLLVNGVHGGGLTGHGSVTSATNNDKAVLVDVDALRTRGEHIPFAELTNRMPGVLWNPYPATGTHLAEAEAAALRDLWSEYVGPVAEDPISPAPGSLPQEAIRRVGVNRYERDPQARRECIAHHGTSCAACGFSFGTAYGALGREFIQVHHIVPPSQLGAGYQLDALTDLVPLCPNCHAMAHLRTPDPYTAAELRRIIAAAGHVDASIVSDEELAAQEAATRILEAGSRDARST